MSPMFVPGPVDVDPDVLAAQTQPMLPHRSKEFEAIFHRAENKVRELFGTKHRVFLTASSGPLMVGGSYYVLAGAWSWDVAWLSIVFALGPTTVLFGKHTDKLEAPWGQPIDPNQVADTLKGGDYEIITIVHNETSTGLMNPVSEIAAAAREVSPETLVCVDAVSSLAGTKIEMDAWGVDFTLTSSQKALALPPGLGLGATSDRALSRAETVGNRGWYFDLVRLENHRTKNTTPATPAISLIYALDIQIDRIFAEGLENRFSRHAEMAKRVQNWALDRGFGLYAAEGYRSQTVTTVENTRNIDISALNANLLERGMRIANGYGNLKNKTFRIAHMGELTITDVDVLLCAIDKFIKYA